MTNSKSHQVDGVEDLNLSDAGAARVGEVSAVVVWRQRAQPGRVRRGLPDGVENLHVPDVMHVKGLLQTNHKPL